MGVLVYIFLSLCVVNVTIAADVNGFAASDSFILSLLSEKLGKSSTAYKVLSRIQNGAFELLSTSSRSLTANKKKKFLTQLEVAAAANNTEKVHELLGKLLFIIQSTESSAELARITSKYASLLSSSSARRRVRKSTDPFDPIYSHLYILGGGSTLLFAIDTTGSMAGDIAEAQVIVSDIVVSPRLDEVDYILSPFNDPATGPVTTRPFSERNLFINDVNALTATGGGDCPELAFTGMQNAMNAGPRYGSSMFVFTDAAPKDGDDFTVQNIIDIAILWYDMKISFFLDEHMCGSAVEIAKYQRVADETGGEVFSLETIAKKRKRRSAPTATSAPRTRSVHATRNTSTTKSVYATRSAAITRSIHTTRSAHTTRRAATTNSPYSAYVASSLSGTSLVTSGTSASSGSRSINIHTFVIDESISYAYIIVTFELSTTSILLSDPNGITKLPTSYTLNAIIYEVKNPLTGIWKLTVDGKSGTYSYKVSVAFKEPIAFDVRYLFEEIPGSYILVKRPLIGQNQKLLINFVGGSKINATTVSANLVDLDGNNINSLSLTSIGSGDGLKYSASFVPPNKSFRVKLTGKSIKGLRFERTTEHATTPSQIIFKTFVAGDELSVKIGSGPQRILIGIFIKEGLTKTLSVTASARYGSVTPNNRMNINVRTKGFFPFKYTPPSDTSLKGKSSYITIQASYDVGEIVTHRISVLLV